MRVGAYFGACLLCAGCTVGPNYKRPAAPAPAQWEVARALARSRPQRHCPQDFLVDRLPRRRPEHLETDLLAANQTLKVAVRSLSIRPVLPPPSRTLNFFPLSPSIRPPSASVIPELDPPAPRSSVGSRHAKQLYSALHGELRSGSRRQAPPHHRSCASLLSGQRRRSGKRSPRY